MKYLINQKQLTCINILIKVLEEAINRNCFSDEEIKKIYKTIEQLTSKS